MSKTIRIILFMLSVCLPLLTFSQSTIIGAGSYGSNMYGPMYKTTNPNSLNRHAYIYSKSLLGELKHGDSISSIAFYKYDDDGFSGNNNLKIYIGSTKKNDFGTGMLDWNFEISLNGFQKVYDDNPNAIVNSKIGFVTFPFDFPYYWDTSLGENLELLVEFTQPNAQTSSVVWLYDNSASQTQYFANQTKYSVGTYTTKHVDTLTRGEERKPMIKIDFPRINNDVSVKALYSLGKIPVPLGNPDTIKVVLQNAGKFDVKNRKAYIYSYGANTFFDSLEFSLKKQEQGIFSFPIHNISNIGMDTLLVYLEQDEVSSNDTLENLRLATEYTYSYKNIKEPPAAGGIGFSGATGDFVAKFNSTQPKEVNQISVMFGFGQQNFKIGIWDGLGVNGTPGNLIWESDTQVSRPGEFIMPVWPPVSVNGTFFVGVRQIETSNIAFGFQHEDPVRNGTFFETSPVGSNQWIDFSPYSPFRFMIEPRIQGENDVTPVSFDFPLDTLIFGNFDTIAPRATIRNIGSKDQNVPFEIQCNIKYYGGQLMYTSIITDTLSSGEQHQVTFEKSFFPKNTAEYTVEIITRLPTDQFKENDTLHSVILAGKYSDVGMVTVFVPMNGAVYDFNIDTIFPTVRAENFGFDTQSFKSFAEIYDDGDSLIWRDSTTTQITGGQSATIDFQELLPYRPGTYRFVSYTVMDGDRDLFNDTVYRIFLVVKDNDVAANFAIEPKQSSSYPEDLPSLTPTLNVKNLGELHQTTYFPVYCFIYKGDNLFYSDTAKIQVFMNDSTTAYFKSINNPPEGNYRAFFTTGLITDQDRRNDTLTVYFKIGVENDIQVLEINNPASDSTLDLSEIYRPSITIRNNGFRNQVTPFPLFFQSVDSTGRIIQTIQTSVSLDAKQERVVYFDSVFKAMPEGLLQIRAFSDLKKDEIRANDTFYSVVNVKMTYDFEVLEWITNNQNEKVGFKKQEYVPTIVIRNNSILNTDSAFISVLIKSPNGVYVYNYIRKTYPELFGGLDTISFPAYMPEEIGIYDISVSIFQFEDQNAFNDTLTYGFESILFDDLEVLEIVYPKQNDTLILSQVLKDVEIIVVNNGNSSPKDAFIKLTLLDYQSNLIKSEVKPISPTLNYLDTDAIYFNNFFDDINYNKTNPLHSLQASILFDEDIINENDTLNTDIYIFANSSVLALSPIEGIKIYPNPFTNTITINLQNSDGLNFSLNSFEGKEILSGTIPQGVTNHEIYTEKLAPGVYHLKINNGKHIFAVSLIKL